WPRTQLVETFEKTGCANPLTNVGCTSGTGAGAGAALAGPVSATAAASTAVTAAARPFHVCMMRIPLLLDRWPVDCNRWGRKACVGARRCLHAHRGGISPCR